MAAQPPLVTREFLRQLPWLMAGLGFTLGLFQLVLVPEPARWWLWLALVVGGALFGMYGKYRARFAVTQGIVVIVGLFWLLAMLCAGPAALLAQVLGHPQWAWPVFALVLANFCGFAALGWWRAERPWRQARATGQWLSCLSRHADLATHQLALSRGPASAQPSLHAAFWPALGVNLPVAAVAAFGEGADAWLMAAVLVALAPLLAWLVMRFVARLPVYLNLRRYEREHGVRFVSAEAGALAQARSTFGLRHWLCRPEDRVVSTLATAGQRPRRRR